MVLVQLLIVGQWAAGQSGCVGDLTSSLQVPSRGSFRGPGAADVDAASTAAVAGVGTPGWSGALPAAGSCVIRTGDVR
jgi:hypothetical protein